MRLPEPPARSRRGENVIPLINVVFLLLIFFMIAGSLSRTELFRVDPPASMSEAPLPPDPTRVLLAADGRLAVQGEPVSLEDLPRALETADGGSPAVEIKADQATPVTRLMTVLKVLRQSGVDEVELVTARETGGR